MKVIHKARALYNTLSIFSDFSPVCVGTKLLEGGGGREVGVGFSNVFRSYGFCQQMDKE